MRRFVCDVRIFLFVFEREESRKAPKSAAMQLNSTITCPACGHQSIETMPTDACQFFYVCGGCGARLKPKAGDCCVFCSYGSVPCPPVQEGSGKACS
jgi:hypothetical protein